MYAVPVAIQAIMKRLLLGKDSMRQCVMAAYDRKLLVAINIIRTLYV